jgi:hypothetical protein
MLTSHDVLLQNPAADRQIDMHIKCRVTKQLQYLRGLQLKATAAAGLVFLSVVHAILGCVAFPEYGDKKKSKKNDQRCFL